MPRKTTRRGSLNDSGANEDLEVGVGVVTRTSRGPCFPSVVPAAAFWVVSALMALWIGEGRAAAQTIPPISQGILLTGPRDAAQHDDPSGPGPGPGLVQVEVVVTDPDHNPVTGLPEEAFFLEEDGQRQRLLSFEAVDRGSASARAVPRSGTSRARVSTNAAVAAVPGPRTFVVVFDDLHLSPEGALLAKEISQELLTQHMGGGDLVVFVAPGAELVRSVTMPEGQSDLVDVLATLGGQRQTPSLLTDYESFRIVEERDSAVEEHVLQRLREAGSQQWPRETVRSEARQVLEGARARRRRLLTALAAALEVLPGVGTRKSVLLVSEGFFYEPGDPLSYQVIAASQRTNAVVHFLDVRGRTAPRSPLRGESTGAEILANITGGSSAQAVSGVSEALARLAQEASHHYLLGYAPRGDRQAGRLRRLRVGVNRPDAVVRARKGFYDAPGDGLGSDDEPSGLDGPLREALRSSSLIRQIPLRLTSLALAPAGDGQIQVTLASEASAKGLELARTPDGAPLARLDVVMEIRHEQAGANQVASLQSLAVRVPGGAGVEETWLPFQRSFRLPPGRGHVKLAVRDRGSGAIGTVVHPLEVPDPAEFRVSTPILSDMPEGEGVKPPRIVARRSFAPGSVLYCYFEVYPRSGLPTRGPSEARAAYEIVDSRGKVRQRAALPLPVRREGGALGRLVEIPLTRFGPGEYDLVLDLAGEVTGGADELREPFSVTRPKNFNDELYLSALGEYLEGDFESAVTTLLQWPATEILAAAERLPRTEDGLRETALMLHTDLAMVLRRHGRTGGARTHLTIGRAILEGAARADLRREWLLALAYAHQASLRPAEALLFYNECAEAFPDAGEAKLGAGTLHERNAFLPDGFGRGNLHLPPELAAQAAERAYREALVIQPALTEARLRLARVFQKTDRVGQALEQLSLVLESSQDASLTALAHLFLGEISEAQEDVDGALEHYRAALAADPGLQVAALALAQALHERDGREAAVEALVPALVMINGARTSPWLAYREGPRQLSTSSLRALRSRLRAEARSAQ